jgi:hypothetical protein
MDFWHTAHFLVRTITPYPSCSTPTPVELRALPPYLQRFALILTRTRQAYTIGRLDFSAKPAVRILRYGSITLKYAVAPSNTQL